MMAHISASRFPHRTDFTGPGPWPMATYYRTNAPLASKYNRDALNHEVISQGDHGAASGNPYPSS